MRNEPYPKTMKLHELVDSYMGSYDYAQLASSSKESYVQMVQALYLCGYKGSEVEGFTRIFTDNLYSCMVVRFGEAKAQQICKVMRKIWNWGYRHDLIQRNPWSKMGLKGITPRHTVWTVEEYDKALAACPDTPGYSTFHLFLVGLYHTGQRPVDVLNVNPDTDIHMNLAMVDFHPPVFFYEVRITQQKTGKEVIIPLTEKVASYWRIYGKFTPEFKRNYHNLWAVVRARAGIEHLQLRDIRRTVMTQAASGGATDAQIRAFSGHSGHSKLPETVYVQRDAKQAADGLAKRKM